tara:strand:- start:6058 stop:10008 length:3951 start_codon:yes stop_codon:yes gene_type:complete
MPLEKKEISFPFLKGMDEKTSDATRAPDSLSDCLNGVFDKAGRIKKRGGYVAADKIIANTTTSRIAKGAAVSQYKDETLILDGTKMYTKLSNAEYLSKGTYVPCTFKNEFKRRDPSKKQSNAQMAEHRGVRVYTWMEYGHDQAGEVRVVAAIEDVATGTSLRDDIVLDTSRFRTAGNGRLYATPKPYAIKGTDDDNIWIMFVANAGVPATDAIIEGGSGYSTATGVATFGGTGTGCTIDIDTVAAGRITALSYNNAGTGYTVGDILRVAGGGNNARFRVDSVGSSRIKISKVDCTSVETAAAYAGALTTLEDPSGNEIEVSSVTPQFAADSLHNETYEDNAVIAYSDASGSYSYTIRAITIASGVMQAVADANSYRISTTGFWNPFVDSSSARGSTGTNVVGGIMLKALNDGSSSASDYNIIFGATFNNSGAPEVKLYNIRDDFGAAITYGALTTGPNPLCNAGLHLLSGTAGTFTNGGHPYVALELYAEGQQGHPSGATTYENNGVVPPHFVATYYLTRAADNSPNSTRVHVAHNASILSDMFRHAATAETGLYYVLAHVNDNSLTSTDVSDYGLSNNLALMRHIDNSGTRTNEFVGAVKTGQVANCLTSEYSQCDPLATAISHETTGTINPTSSALVTVLDMGPIQVGWAVYGDGVAASTTVSAINSATTLTMSNNAVVPTNGGPLAGASLTFVDESNALYSTSPMVYGVQRVTSTDSGERFLFGAARFAGYSTSKTGEYSGPETSGNSFGVSLVEVNFDPARPLASLDSDGTWVGTGGYLHGYDGSNIFEVGFATYPSIARLHQLHDDLNNNGGLSAGTYKYKVVYEWTDANGNIHRSAPSGFAEITTTEASSGRRGTVVVSIYIPNFTRKIGIRAIVYRNNDGGSIFYKAGSVPVPEPSSASRRTVNFIDWPRGTSAITTQDDIIYRDPIYTADGELANGFFGSCTDLTRHRNKAFAVGADDNVYFSKPIVDGAELQFPDEFVLRIPGDSSVTTGVESNLDHLLIFTEDNAHFVSGPGPDAFGAGMFAPPRIFGTNQGARAGSAHVQTPLGVFYQTLRGIYLVQRDMSIKYIGAQVEDQVNNLVISMLCHDPTNEVRFMIKDTTASSSDVALTYNYYFGQWSRSEMVYTSSEYQVGEIYDGTYFQKLSGTGFLLKQDNTVFTDTYRVHASPTSTATRNYNLELRTAFIAPSGLLSFDRVYRGMVLGEYISAHTIRLNFYTDYMDTVAVSTGSKELSTAPAGEYEPVAGYVNHPLYLFRAHMTQQKCRAIQAEIKLISGAGVATAPAYLDGIAFEVGVRPKKSALKTIADRTI